MRIPPQKRMGVKKNYIHVILSLYSATAYSLDSSYGNGRTLITAKDKYISDVE